MAAMQDYAQSQEELDLRCTLYKVSKLQDITLKGTNLLPYPFAKAPRKAPKIMMTRPM